MKILVIDDDNFLADTLREQGHSVKHCLSLFDAFKVDGSFDWGMSDCDSPSNQVDGWEG